MWLYTIEECLSENLGMHPEMFSDIIRAFNGRKDQESVHNVSTNGLARNCFLHNRMFISHLRITRQIEVINLTSL